MRLLAMIVVVLAVSFLGVMGYYYVRDGSLQSAGAEVDNKLSAADKATQPLQHQLGKVGDAAKETVHRATDGNDKT
jgi:hypothetical protein